MRLRGQIIFGDFMNLKIEAVNGQLFMEWERAPGGCSPCQMMGPGDQLG